jgi:hypothetical protein
MVPRLAEEVAQRLAAIEGVVAVVLGGSYARGNQRPDSDVDLGLYYREESRFSVAAVRALAGELNDAPSPVVTDFGRWGAWVNGGAWLSVRGQRLDFIYRSLDAVERVVAECAEGRFESDFFLQQPPYGFHSYIYLGEVAVCLPLHDPEGVIAALQQRVRDYPAPLKAAVVARFLWAAEFTAGQARQAATRGDVYNAAGGLARVVSFLLQVLFALNGRYFVHDKGALDEVEALALKPERFKQTAEGCLSLAGPQSLEDAARAIDALVERTVALCGDLYSRPDFRI